MGLDELVFNLKKLVGRDRNSWPVTVRKYELFEDGETVEKTDRGRRVQDPETGQPRYEFLKENEHTISIPRKYLTQSNGHPMLRVLKVQTEEGTEFAPIQTQLEVTADDLPRLKDEEADLDFVVEMSRFIQAGKNEIERHYQITQSEDKAWYQAPITWLVLGSVGMGLFYVMAGIGINKINSGILLPLAFSGKNLANKLRLKR